MQPLDRLLFLSGGGQDSSPIEPVYTKQTVYSGSAGDLIAADWDGDGDIDLLDSKRMNLLQQQPDHSFVQKSAGSGSGIWSRNVSADIDLDGDLDLIGVGSTALIWRLNDGHGVFGPVQTRTSSYTLGDPLVADFNRDSYVDVAVHRMKGFDIFLNNGHGGFDSTVAVNGQGMDTDFGSCAADIDGDDDIDLISPWSGNGLNGIQIARNNGRAGFSGFSVILLGPATYSVGAGDIDSDGDIDIVADQWGAVTAYYNDGTGAFPTSRSVTTGFLWMPSASDLNGDSWPDVPGTSGGSFLLNDKTGALSYSVPFPDVNRLAPIDVDGDGRRDIVEEDAPNVWFSSGFDDVTAPQALRPRFVVNPQIGPPSVVVDFSEDVLASLRASDAGITNLTTGQQIDPASLRLDYSAGDLASWLLPASLPDGNYRFKLSAGDVSDIAGNTLKEDFTFDFFALAGDANHDRIVDVTDLGILATNWQGTGKTFSQADFNYDGKVDVTDLGILAGNWQKSLPEAASLTQGQKPAVASTMSLAASSSPKSIAATANSFKARHSLIADIGLS